MANTYDIGDLVRITGKFSTLAGTALDPTTVTLIVKTPDGLSQTLAYPDGVQRTALGTFLATFVTTMSGAHYYRWQGTGAVVAAGELYFFVQESDVL